jgi:hypothetical protein
LADEVFKIKGGKATAASKTAQAALKKAKPGIANLKKLPANTLVVVPAGLEPPQQPRRNQ